MALSSNPSIAKKERKKRKEGRKGKEREGREEGRKGRREEGRKGERTCQHGFKKTRPGVGEIAYW
jgi:hypothetical protein